MFTVTIDTDNAAFGETPHEANAEVARILHKLAVHVTALGRAAHDGGEFTLRDYNGNAVGTARFAEEEPAR